MTTGLTISCKVHFKSGNRGRRRLRAGEPPTEGAVSAGRIPRVARLMALAIRFDGLIRSGKVGDYAELARLGHVTRGRITQIMNLLLLAPDIQEQLLFLPRVEHGSDPVLLNDLQPIAATLDWQAQRYMWAKQIARFNT